MCLCDKMTKKKCQILIAIIATILAANLVTAQSSICQGAQDCDACMRIDSGCHWCEDQNFTLSGRLIRSRCDDISVLQPICSNIISLNSSLQITQNEDFGSIIQVRPQQVKVALRPGQAQSFQVNVKPAENFPVDIYFLNDLSKSMEDNLKSLRLLANDIANAIGTITTNYRLGFGAFIDKPTQPQVLYSEPDFPQFPCNADDVTNNECTSREVFGFAHLFDFSANTTEFSNAIEAQITSGDIDSAEGCLDGLMQVVVCESQIKWKPKKQGRRIVVMVTDAEPKLAGEGKISNIVRPNDGKCYLKERTVNFKILNETKSLTELYYYRSTEQDYPSLSQLRHVMLENEVTPILAVEEEFLHLYQVLAENWADIGAAVDSLTSNSSNIVNLVRDNYNRIATTVGLTDDAPPYLEISYQVDPTTCKSPARVVSNSICADVKLNQSIIFDIQVKLKFCPDPLPENPQVTVRISGFGAVTIDLEYLCQCNCTVEPKSSKCNGKGTYACGTCTCDEGFFGHVCQCDASQSSHNDTSLCVDPKSPKTLCNGDGQCICGQCECLPQESPRIISGQYCQCRNYGCPKINRDDVEECGGPTRGVCGCGICRCITPYTGVRCESIECPVLKNQTCRKGGIECNGHGTCGDDCKTCICEPGYEGINCEKCITQDCKCSTIDASCLSCHLANITCPVEKDCASHEFIPLSNNETFVEFCPVFFNEVCQTTFNFTGESIHNTTRVWMYKQGFICASPRTEGDDTDTLAIVLGIIAGILLLGLLLLLLWKLLVTLHDKKEYAKFEKSANDSQWEKDGNPIYREPNQQFDNPAFAGSS